ncbi:hypothetical protein [Roseovarius sp. EL26]|uniref:hypothetical protein n=1 Tax=Roseovarius sp. EL26 TaxID=2126672 RepID=UPI0013C513E9|nr:hypothetical protein [Roseovarius sp. EL26]
MHSNVIWGYGGENIIGNFVDELSHDEVPTVSVDPTIDKAPPSIEGPVNLLTSNHFTRDIRDLNRNYGSLNITHDFYDLLGTYDIQHMFFFVHDHSEFFVLDEPIQLQPFTTVVTPWPSIHRNASRLNLFCCDVNFKNFNEFDSIRPVRKGVWLVSNIEYGIARLGLENFAQEIYEFAAASEISIKLPVYGDIHDRIGNILLEKGVDVVDPFQSSAVCILESEFVISSMCSGVAALAAYYQKDIIVVDNGNYPPLLDSKRNGYTEWLPNSTVINTPEELKRALDKKTETGKTRHQCGVFREDFWGQFHNELF